MSERLEVALNEARAEEPIGTIREMSAVAAGSAVNASFPRKAHLCRSGTCSLASHPSACAIDVGGKEVDTVRTAALVAGGLLIAVAAFQAALAAGAPWGAMSYGGRAETADGVLPATYRAMSAAAVVILLFAAWIVLARAGVVAPGFTSTGFLRIGAWVVFGYLVLNTVTNVTSSHAGERFGLGAITLVSALACFIVARAPTDVIGS